MNELNLDDKNKFILISFMFWRFFKSSMLIENTTLSLTNVIILLFFLMVPKTCDLEARWI